MNIRLSLIPQKDDYAVAALTSIAVSIHIIEFALPSLLPGIKPGITNIIILIVLYQYGMKVALWVNLLRVITASILLGTFLSIGFWLSLSGAIGSLLTLLLFYRLPKIGPVGLSLVSALGHTISQFYVAYWIFLPHPDLLLILPALVCFAIIFGLLNGVITVLILRKLA